MIWVHVRTWASWGCWPNPRELGDGSVAGYKEVRDWALSRPMWSVVWLASRASQSKHHVYARVYPAHRQGNPSTTCLHGGRGFCSHPRHVNLSPNARCPYPRAPSPTKIWVDHFLSNYPFNTKCIPTKRQPHISHAVLETLCGKGWFAITLLQSTVLCV